MMIAMTVGCLACTYDVALCLGGQESNILSATDASVFVHLQSAAAAFSGGHLSSACIAILLGFAAQNMKIEYSHGHTLSSIYS